MTQISLKKYFQKSQKKLNLKPLIIAEISANHSGSKKKFLKLIRSAAMNGADLVKIQTYEAKDITLNNYKVGNLNLWNLYSKAKTPLNWHKDAFKLAKKLNIILFSTPFSVRAVQFLEKFNVRLYKISSFEITDLLLIDAIAKTKKPIILSTGMASLKEIDRAVNCIKKYHSKITILHCVSGYPTKEEDINLSRLVFMRQKYKEFNIGLSDHTDDINSSIASCCLGATFIEKHYILNKNDKSLDQKFSIDPKQLKKLSIFAKEIYKSLLNKKKLNNLPNSKGESYSKLFRRSIFLTKNLNKGDKITLNNVSTFRPSIGIKSENIFKVIGKRVNKNKKKNEPLRYADLLK